MSPLIAVGASLLGGWLGKRGGKKVEEATGIPLQKVLAPALAAAGAGTAVAVPEVAAGDTVPLAALAGEGGPAFMIAVCAHTILKNLAELVRAFAELKRS